MVLRYFDESQIFQWPIFERYISEKQEADKSSKRQMFDTI
jgi:hypothetical protein